jgi:hypothetical protein
LQFDWTFRLESTHGSSTLVYHSTATVAPKHCYSCLAL